MADNPYQTPTTEEPTNEIVSTDPVAIRREHLPYEIMVKCIGAYWIMCIVLAGWHVWSYLQSTPETGIQWREPLTWVLCIATAIAILKALTGVFLIRRNQWSYLAIILALTSIWGLSFACLVNLFLLFTLFSKKGKRILAPDYQQIVAATPHIKCRNTWPCRLLFGILSIAAFLPLLSDLYVGTMRHSVIP